MGMRLIIEMETGERHLFNLEEQILKISSNSNSLQNFLKLLKDSLNLNQSLNFVLFSAPPLRIIDSLEQLISILNQGNQSSGFHSSQAIDLNSTLKENQIHKQSQSTLSERDNLQIQCLKLFRRETFVKIFRQLEVEAQLSGQDLSFLQQIKYTEEELAVAENQIETSPYFNAVIRKANQKSQIYTNDSALEILGEAELIGKKRVKQNIGLISDYDIMAHYFKMKYLNDTRQLDRMEIYRKKQKEMETVGWDDEVLHIYHFQNVKTAEALRNELEKVVTRIGFQVKIEENISLEEIKLTKEVQQDIYKQEIDEGTIFQKYSCAYPIQKCSFFLLYKIIKGSLCILFAFNLIHNHQMGPVQFPNLLKIK